MYRNAKKHKEGIEYLKSVIEKDSKNIELIFLLGVIYEEIDEFDNFLIQMAKVIKVDPKHANALNYIGYTLAEKGIRLNDAEKYIKRALEVKPSSGHIIDSLGWLYYKKGDYDKAVKELERAMTFLPEDPVIAEHLGDAYIKTRNLRKALAVYEKAVSLDPNNKDLNLKLEKLKTTLSIKGSSSE